MPCAQASRSLWNWLPSAKHVTPFGPASRALSCSQILPAQDRPQTRDRRIHTDVHRRLLAGIVRAMRPGDRTLGRLGPKPIRTLNEESGSGSSFQAAELLPFLSELRLACPE